jgi:predicted nucleic acid-binding protein
LRKKNLTLTEALEIIEFVENKLRLVEYNVNSTQVLELVNISICSAYDCEFVALAKQLNVRLVTADKQLLKEFPKNTLALQKV